MLAAVLLVAGYFTWSVENTNAQLRATNEKLVAQAKASRKEGLVIEHRLCLDLGTMAAIPPPAGSPLTNPSRGYEQSEHRAWAGLYTGVCRK
jgi:hypothetical protein